MRHGLRLLAAGLAIGTLASCQTLDEGYEQEVMNSIPYDSVACGELVAQRDALAARHGVSGQVEREARPESRFMGVGPLVPDLRSNEARERGLAIGTIDAMNRSLARRGCA